jgi:mono/diheme cytochrome c family protein
MKFIAGAATSLVTAIAIALLAAISGVFDVAASLPDSDLERFILHSVMRRSVQVRAPPEYQRAWTDKQIGEGFIDYDAMCVMCHAAPGIERSSISRGMNPQPPLLADAAKQWRNEDLFWIIKNGVKMTGMPAFGLAHRDDEIWNIVGFVRQLSGISPQEYKELRDKFPNPSGGHDYH